MKLKELKKKLKNSPYPSISYRLGKEIEERTGMEVRITVPGHTQRGGSPCPYDRVLSTRLGARAAQLIIQEEYGYTQEQIAKIQEWYLEEYSITSKK